MYTFGVSINLSMYLYAQRKTGSDIDLNPLSLIRGYGLFTWILVVNYALMRLLMGFVMKYLSNIHKLLMAGSSMFVSSVFTFTLLGVSPSGTYVIGLAIVTAALFA